MNIIWLLPIVCLIGIPTSTSAQTIVREGPMEKLILFDAASAKTWSPAECTVDSSTAHVKSAQAALHWHVTVDYFQGEKKYPIGWPRFNHSIPESMRDWSAWDYLHMWIFTTSNRKALPHTPAGFSIQAPDKSSTLNTTLESLRLGEWIELKIPVSQLSNPRDVKSLQFHMAEANYKHQDELDLYICDFALMRYADPTLLDFAAETAVAYNDERGLPVRFRLTGIKPGSQAEVQCELLRDNVSAATVTVTAERGFQRVLLKPAQKKLPPGLYEIRARVTGSSQAATAQVRMVESPWK